MYGCDAPRYEAVRTVEPCMERRALLQNPDVHENMTAYAPLKKEIDASFAL